MKRPSWLKKEAILALHDQLLAEHAGNAGIRNKALLESVLARPQNLFAYGKPSLFDLAAACACGIIKNHPFADGNKRTGFMAAYVFLGINGIEFVSDEGDVVLKTLGVAASELNEEDYAAWLQESSRVERPRKC